jgi:hypothetical protein
LVVGSWELVVGRGKWEDGSEELEFGIVKKE